MPRWRRRLCRFLDSDKIYKPAGMPFNNLEVVDIFIDEFEALRLCDHEKLSQIEAAQRMKVSRATVQRLLEAGRFKITDAILTHRAIRIRNNFKINVRDRNEDYNSNR